MKRIILLLVLVVTMSALVLGACSEETPAPTSAPTATTAPSPTTAEPKTIELTFNTQCPGPPQASVYEPTERFVKKVAERTNGRVKIVMFYANTLASPAETFDATVKGISDIGESNTGYTAGRFRITDACTLPYGFSSSFVQSNVINDFIANYQPKEWDEVVSLGFITPPPFALGTTGKAVRTIEDMNGLIIRATNKSAADLLELLGATPRVVPIPEVYELLSKGVIDGQTSGPEAWPGFKLTEVCNNMTNIQCVAMGNVTYVVMNKDSFAKLSSEDQQIVKECGKEFWLDRANTWDTENDKAIEAFKAMPGKEYIELAPEQEAKFRAAAQKVIDQWIADMTADGYPAAEYVQYVRDRIDYWEAQR